MVVKYIHESTANKKGYTVQMNDLVLIIANHEDWNTYEELPDLGLPKVVYARLKSRVRTIITVHNNSSNYKIKSFKSSPRDRTPLFYMD